jgi:hypothetical protein
MGFISVLSQQPCSHQTKGRDYSRPRTGTGCLERNAFGTPEWACFQRRPFSEISRFVLDSSEAAKFLFDLRYMRVFTEHLN